MLMQNSKKKNNDIYEVRYISIKIDKLNAENKPST